MDRDELKNALIASGISSAAYSLSGGTSNESYVLVQESEGQWAVYYCERGQRVGLRLFSSESEACEHFLDRILDDPTTRREF